MNFSNKTVVAKLETLARRYVYKIITTLVTYKVLPTSDNSLVMTVPRSTSELAIVFWCTGMQVRGDEEMVLRMTGTFNDGSSE